MREAHRFREPWGRSFQKKCVHKTLHWSLRKGKDMFFQPMRKRHVEKNEGGGREGLRRHSRVKEGGGGKVRESCRNEIAFDNLCPSPRFSEISLSIPHIYADGFVPFLVRRQFLTIPRWRSDCEHAGISMREKGGFQ